MIEIKIENVGNINIQRMWSKSNCTIELSKDQATSILRDLLFEAKIASGLYLAEIQELPKITGEILAENAEELEAV